MEYPLYGLCGDGVIIFENGMMTIIGDVFLIDQGVVTRLSGVLQ